MWLNSHLSIVLQLKISPFKAVSSMNILFDSMDPEISCSHTEAWMKLLTHYKHWEVMVEVCLTIFLGIKNEKWLKETEKKTKNTRRKQNWSNSSKQQTDILFPIQITNKHGIESSWVFVYTHSIIVIWMKCESMQTRANFVTWNFCMLVLRLHIEITIVSY